MGIVDKRNVATLAAATPAPVYQEQNPLPEPEPIVQVVQPNTILAHRVFARFLAIFGGGGIPPGNQAGVYPSGLQARVVVPHPGPNQAVIQAAEPIPRLPIAVGLFHRARICLTIAATLLIAVSIRSGSAASVAGMGVGNTWGMGVEHVVRVYVKAVDAAVVQATVVLPAKPKPMATDPATN